MRTLQGNFIIILIEGDVKMVKLYNIIEIIEGHDCCISDVELTRIMEEMNINKDDMINELIERGVMKVGDDRWIKWGTESYTIDKKEYKNAFRVKYSFYSLMRGLFFWFQCHKDDDELAFAFEKFQKRISGTHGQGKNYNLTCQFNFYSDKFILERLYGLSDRNLKDREIMDSYNQREQKICSDLYKLSKAICDLNNIEETEEKIKEIEKLLKDELGEDFEIKSKIFDVVKNIVRGNHKLEESELTKSLEKEFYRHRGLREAKTNMVDSAFIRFAGDDAEIPNKYFSIIQDPKSREIEENRIIELVKEWIPEKYINEIANNLIEERYFKRSIVTANCIAYKSKNLNWSYICINDDFFDSIAALYDDNYTYQVDRELSCDTVCYWLGINIEQHERLQKTEELLQELFDRQIINNTYYNKDDYGKSKYLVAERLREIFRNVKEVNPYQFIAKLIMTSLCLRDIDKTLRLIWDVNNLSVKENSTFDGIVEQIVSPFISGKDRLDLLVRLNKFNAKNPFYSDKSEYSYLNIFVYEGWEELKGEFKDIKEPIKLLQNTYTYLASLDETEREKYYKAFESVYIKNCLRKSLLTLVQYMIDHESKDYEMFEDIVDYASEITNKNEIEVLDAKLCMLNIWSEESKVYKTDFLKACKELINVYKVTKEESLIPLINKCLTELSADEKINGIEVKDLREIWEKIEAQNGNQDEIRKLYSKYCLSKLEERKELVEKTKKLAFSTNLRCNYREYTLDEVKEDIFIVLGYGKASSAFVNSIKDKQDCDIYIVPQKNEIVEERIDMQSNVHIVTDGFDSIYEFLPLYRLDIACQKDENAFDNYINQISKIHLVALGDDKHENMRNVVEFIEVTWQHYVLYEYMVKFCSKINVKIDFKEVDIVVDAYEYETSYIDSIMNRLDKDFYLRINYVDYRKEIAKELITDYPLFMVDMQEANLKFQIKNPTETDDTEGNSFVAGKTKHNIVLLGDEVQADKIIEVIKALIRVGGYNTVPKDLGDYAAKNASTYEEKIGVNFKLTIFSKNIDEIKERLMFDAPDLFESDNRSYLHNVEPLFIDIDPESYRFINLFNEIEKKEKIEENTQEQETNVPKATSISETGDCEVSKILREATYFVCMLKDDATSYKVATRIRQVCYRIDKSMKHVPIISALCENGYMDTDYNSFTVGIDEEKTVKYKDPWWRSYDIHSFGAFEKCFSYSNLYENYLSTIAWKMHVTNKEGQEYIEKVRAYFKNHYNFMVCAQRAVTIPYVFFAVLYDEMCEDCSLGNLETSDNVWSMEIFEKNILNYIEAYKEKVLVKDSSGKYTDSIESNIILWLAVLEKNRFNVNLTLDGYTSAINGVENKNLFEEYISGWKSRTVDNSLSNKLHIAKLHGDITTWEFSSGKTYDAEYVRNLATYLERGIVQKSLPVKFSEKGKDVIIDRVK